MGSGIADQFSGLTGGVSFPALATPAGATTTPTYTPDVDAGLVTFDRAGGLHTIDWQSFLGGIQYYLPPSGRLWVSVNYSRMKSKNAGDFGDPTKVFSRSQWGDANLFVDATEALRFGVEFAHFEQTYVDGVTAKNNRYQFSSFFIF
jgi:hypothetical protein